MFESKKDECGLRRVPIETDFEWFRPTAQPSEDGQRQAKAMLDAVKRWSAAETPEKPWLVIVGEPGIGKTELVKTAVWTAKLNGHWTRYITAREFNRRAKDFKREWDKAEEGVPVDPEVWVERLGNCAYLAVDDIGAGYVDKGWTLGQFETLFDIRYSMQLPTLITTNLRPDEFQRHIGFRVWSRMFDAEISQALDCSAMTDYRPLKDGGAK